MDSHTRVTYRDNPNFFQRVSNSFMGIFIGFIVIIASFALLWYNEGRAVQTTRSLDEGLSKLISLKSTEVAIAENNGKLVYLTGPLKTDKPLSNAIYGVAVQAVKLRRSVEMYQWVEHEHKTEYNEGDKTRIETTYSYSKEWRSNMVSSGSFNNPSGHHNPNSMLVQSQMSIAENVQVGNFYLSQGLVSSIADFKKLQSVSAPSDSKIHLIDGVFYHSKNAMTPEVGDLKVSFDYAGVSGKVSANIGPPEYVSIIAKQQGLQLTSYETDAGDHLEILNIGQFTPQEIFDRQHSMNHVMTMGLRLLGWFLVFIGLSSMTSLIYTLVDWFPIVRELVSIGITLLNISVSISLSLTVIALAWIRYRPVFGVTILGMALIPFVLSRKRAQSMKRH